jgi:anti-anti-sigma regulatory factor
MVDMSMTYTGTGGLLTIRGRLHESSANDLRTYLLNGINHARRLVVNCEKVESVDIGCLKMLCTAYRVSRRLKKDFSLIGDRAALVRLAGGSASLYDQCAMREQSCSAECLWIDRDNDSELGCCESGPWQDGT